MKQKTYILILIGFLMFTALSAAGAGGSHFCKAPKHWVIEAGTGPGGAVGEWATCTEVPAPTVTSTSTATLVPPIETPTPTGTATAVPPTETPEPTLAPDTADTWHEPGAHDDLNPHEHGDAPPQWAEDWSTAEFGHGVIYGGDEQTPNENVLKHNFFKGYHTLFYGGEQYWRFHMGTGVVNQVGVFHSLEVYMLDPAGNVSFLQGWVNFAAGNEFDPAGATVNYFQRPDGCDDPDFNGPPPAGRPRMIINSLYCFNNFGIYNFESWYSDFHSILPTTGINSQDTFFFTGEPSPDGNLGLARRIEANWSPGGLPAGWFYADQFGRIQDGPNDGDCGSIVTVHGQNHVTLCLRQYVAGTAISFGFPGNAVQKMFPGAGIVELPN